MSNQFCCLYQERLCGKGSVPLVVHWDGKLLQDLTWREHVYRLPVLVSGYGVNKLLGVPKLTSGTGENTAAAVYTLLQDWGVAGQALELTWHIKSNVSSKRSPCALTRHRQILGTELALAS